MSQRRIAVDWAIEIQRLVNHDYTDSDTIVLVCDQLNIHKLASLYEAFPPATARRLVERLEIHHTPKHGSWLNIGDLQPLTFAVRLNKSRCLHFERFCWGKTNPI